VHGEFAPKTSSTISGILYNLANTAQVFVSNTAMHVESYALSEYGNITAALVITISFLLLYKPLHNNFSSTYFTGLVLGLASKDGDR
jgi:hypothetical protein